MDETQLDAGTTWEESMVSVIARWTESFAEDATAAQRSLREAVEHAGGPLCEPVAGSGEVEVCFVWFGQATTVSLSCQLLGSVPAPMTRLDADDQPVWMLATQAPPGTTIPYQFVIDDPLHGVPVEALMRMLADDERSYFEAVAEQQRRKVADPANPRSIAPQTALMTGDDPRTVPPERWESVLDLAPGRPTAAATSRTESTRNFRLRSEALDNDRRVVVRSTASAQESSGRWLLVALDGDLFDGPWGLLDAVHERSAHGELPPIDSVAIYNASLAARATEMIGRDEMATMLADELPGWLRDRRITVPGPARTIVAGVSATGLAAAHTAFQRPDVYGNVLSCSGGFTAGPAEESGTWYGLGSSSEPEWLTRRVATEPPSPVRFWLDVGLLEHTPMPQTPGLSILAANRHLRTVLRARGYDVTLHQFPGGHDLVHWQHTVLDGVQHLTTSKHHPAETG
ncbi:alpha/beta hydrolase-fold protein [Actinopolyspora halophila]|uniref:alpha/beta hydrolase-fold protein n=1 Tax=Actinopolyspora halophila TaxID=1850 RepID=UPI000381C94C|nr:alpha/beta hydrolase-fold protein [Actinopolyspora halophila]